MQLYDRQMTPRELQSRMGDISQAAGITPYVLADGAAKGMKGYLVRTGSGLSYNVLEDRALDIAGAEYCGVPLAHLSKAGISAPWYYDSFEDGWLKTFNGGLVTTCGFSNVGAFCSQGGKRYGLHGRASALPAQNVCARMWAEEDELRLEISGSIRQAVIEGECLCLERRITSYVGESRIEIKDRLINEGFRPEPVLLLYHMNFGYPIVSEDSQLEIEAESTTPFSELFPASEGGRDSWMRFEPPHADAKTQVFSHKLVSGRQSIALKNLRLGIGAELSFDSKELPCFSQAKVMMPQDYYCVLEPGNCFPVGRAAQEEKYGMEILMPGETKEVSLSISILSEA